MLRGSLFTCVDKHLVSMLQWIIDIIKIWFINVKYLFCLRLQKSAELWSSTPFTHTHTHTEKREWYLFSHIIQHKNKTIYAVYIRYTGREPRMQVQEVKCCLVCSSTQHMLIIELNVFVVYMLWYRLCVRRFMSRYYWTYSRSTNTNESWTSRNKKPTIHCERVWDCVMFIRLLLNQEI